MSWTEPPKRDWYGVVFVVILLACLSAAAALQFRRYLNDSSAPQAVPAPVHRQPCPDGFCPIPQRQKQVTKKRQGFHYAIGKLFGSRWLGSCVLVDHIDGKSLAFACEHQVDEGGSFEVSFYERKSGSWKRFPATLISTDRSLDLAVLEFDGPSVATPIEIHPSVPARGQSAEILGYGGRDGGGRDWLSGKSGRFTETDERNVSVSGLPAIGGDSGGAIVTSGDGRLVGILSGSDERRGYSTGCGPGPLRQWLARWRERRRSERPPVPLEEPPGRPFDVEIGDGSGCECPECDCKEDGESGGVIGWAKEKIEEKADDGSRLGSIASKVLTVGELVAIIAGGGGIGAVGFGLFRLWRKTRRRRKGSGANSIEGGQDEEITIPTGGSGSSAVTEDRTVVVDHPVRKTVIERRNVTVPIEVPSRRLQAIHMGMEEFVRRYPAQRDFVESINAFADQYESGL